MRHAMQQRRNHKPAKVAALMGKINSFERDSLTHFHRGESVVKSKECSPKNPKCLSRPHLTLFSGEGDHSKSMTTIQTIPVKKRSIVKKRKLISR